MTVDLSSAPGIIFTLGSMVITGGLGAAIVTAIKDIKNNKAQRSHSAEEAYYKRLSERVQKLEEDLEEERMYNAIIVSTLAKNGIAIPARLSTHKIA